MIKNKIIYTILIVGMSILLSGCGSDSKENPIEPIQPPATNGYAFSNLISELNVTEYKTYNISFTLTKDGLVVPSATVFMKHIDKSMGSVDKYSVVTDEQGEGIFIYSPPAIFPENGNLIIQFTDTNITISKSIKVNFNLDTSLSEGRLTTLSVSYEDSECDVKKGQIGHYHVHAVDRKSNLPVVGIPISFSLVNGVIEFNGDKVHKASGTINNTKPIVFKDVNIDYGNTNIEVGDNLIIFPSEEKTDVTYLGGWNIDSISNILTLGGSYTNLVSENNLTYIIGNEERVLGGSNGNIGTLTVAHVETVESETNNDGYAYFDIISDFMLAGHTVSVEAHGDENGKRIGISKKIFIRLDGDDFSANDITVSNDQNRTLNVTMHLKINPSCSGDQPLVDVPVSPRSFETEPTEHCKIVGADTSTDDSGNISVSIQTDGNATAASSCTVKWQGGPSSLGYEY